MIKFFLTFLLLTLNSYITYAETIVVQSTGYINSVEVLKQLVTKQTPKTEKVCETKRVPINQANQGFGADNLIGALIGGAIGNQLGKGGGKQGSTAIGALIGSEIVRNDKQARANNGHFTEKEICKLQKIVHTETIEKISGYRLNIEIDGQLISINSNRSYNPGDIISIKKQIKYSIY